MKTESRITEIDSITTESIEIVTLDNGDIEETCMTYGHKNGGLSKITRRLNNDLHNIDHPSVEYIDVDGNSNNLEYWIIGNRITEEKFNKMNGITTSSKPKIDGPIDGKIIRIKDKCYKILSSVEVESTKKPVSPPIKSNVLPNTDSDIIQYLIDIVNGKITNNIK